jgi:hypothetical protein
MMNIYWLDSLDHGEDWFVAANNMREAMALFADDMGYDLVEDEVRAREVCAVPEEVTIAQTQFLDEDQITACGGKFIHYDDKDLLVLVDQALLDSLGVETRIVRFEYQIFIEGNVARAALQTLKSQFLL